jgi:hypothetical protein
MANGGWYGTRDEWDRIEKPLIEVDSILDEFSRDFALHIEKNERDWPSRAFVWANGDVRCLIQLYLADQADLTFNLWLCASLDQNGKRYWKQEMTIKQEPVGQFKAELASYLQQGYQQLQDWSATPANLEYATDLAG